MKKEEEYIWLNQKYFYHKDSEFTSNGSSIEMTITCNTTDLQNYSPPTLNISIFNEKIRYCVNLKYQDIVDLIKSIEDISKNIDEVYKTQGTEIRRIFNGKNFKLIFKTSQNTNKRAVLIIIAQTLSDFGMIPLSYELFLSMFDLFKLFKSEYMKISFDISNRAMLSCMLDEIRQIRESVKSLPSSIIPNITKDNSKILNNEISDENENKNPLQEEYDQYMVENIDKVKIPEFEEKIEIKKEENSSILINEILKGDIENIQNLIISCTTHSNPINALKELFSKYIDIPLPEISDEDYKSACYLSKYFFLYNVQNSIRNNIKIPSSIPVLKYKVNPSSCSFENVDLAYDLLLISTYVRLIKNKLETRVDDNSINHNLLYLALRNFTDIFVFSFLEGRDHTIISSIIMEKYKYFRDKGFFNNFDKLLENYNLSPIVESDIKGFLDQIVNKIVDKTIFIRELHENNFKENKVKLPINNSLSLEQITNELIKTEIDFKFDIPCVTLSVNPEILKIVNREDRKEKVKCMPGAAPRSVPSEKNEEIEKNDWFGNLMA